MLDVRELDGFDALVDEYDEDFIVEYFDSEGELPPEGLEVVPLGPASTAQQQHEAMGRYVAEAFEGELGGLTLSPYISIDYEALGRDALTGWGETMTYAFREG